MTLVELAYKLRPYIEKAARSLDDTDALEAKQLYPKWKDLCDAGHTEEKEGFRFRYGDDLYKTKIANFTFQSQWVPGVGTESIFERIEVVCKGTASDPIPYEGNMELVEGKYYTQDGVLYLCTRNSGAAVYHPLSALVGLYVEVVT